LKRIFLLWSLLLFATACFAQSAQSKWFVNAGLSALNYWGDLRDKRITPKGVKPSVTAGISYQLSPHWLSNFSLAFGKLAAFDHDNGLRWYYRNLNFQTSLFETALTAEYDLIDITEPDDGNYIDNNPKRFTPYAFIGVGLFHFNPYTYDLSGKKVFLAPLGTEGQPTPYSLWQVSLPYGVGLKYSVTQTFLISAEINLRKTFTDYIDDVSIHHYLDTTQLLATHGQEAASLSYRADEIPGNKYSFQNGYRGNPDKKDGYYSFLLKATLQIFTKRPKFYYGY